MACQPGNAERDEELNLLSAHGGRWIHGKSPRRQHFSSVAQTCPNLRPPWTAACQGSLSFPISQSLLKLMSIGSVMPSNHLTLCRPLLLLPSIFPSIRVFSNELALGKPLILPYLTCACVHAKLLQSCLTLCDPMDCSPPGSSVHRILQARIPEWVAMPTSRGSSQSRDRTHVS